MNRRESHNFVAGWVGSKNLDSPSTQDGQAWCDHLGLLMRKCLHGFFSSSILPEVVSVNIVLGFVMTRGVPPSICMQVAL